MPPPARPTGSDPTPDSNSFSHHPNPNEIHSKFSPLPSPNSDSLSDSLSLQSPLILPIINATLSHPTIQSLHPAHSTGSSSSDSSTSSSSSQPNLNPTAISHLNSSQLPNSSPGLIPFAMDSSPSPRKISLSVSQSLLMAPLDSLDPLAQAAEDDRLGSVRGKRPERLLRRNSSRLNHHSTLNSSESTLLLNTNQSLLYHPAINHPQSDQSNSILTISNPITSDRPPAKPISNSLSKPNPSTMSSSRRRTEPKTDVRRSTQTRHCSKTISMDTSSSDTIGKTDFATRPRTDSGPPADRSHSVANQMGPAISQDGQSWDEHEQEHLADQEDMNTPVKARAQPAFTLRHASSVTELMIAPSHLALPAPARPATLTPRASLGHRRSSSAHRSHPRTQPDHHLAIAASRPTGTDRRPTPAEPHLFTRPVMHRANGAKSSLTPHHQHQHQPSLASQPATTPTELCPSPSSSRSHLLNLPLVPQSTRLSQNSTVCCSSPDSTTSSSSPSTHPLPHPRRPRPISSSSNLNPRLLPNHPQTNDHLSSNPFPLPSSNHSITHTHSHSHSHSSGSKLNSVSNHPPPPHHSNRHPVRTPSSISGSTMFTNGHHQPRSPPQSHTGSSTRRHRPGLPQHFIQSVPSSEYADSRAPSRAEARRAAEQTLSSPRSNRTGPPPVLSPRHRTRVGHRYSDTYTLALDRPLGVESALGHYDGHHTYAGGRAQIHQPVRGKHSTWSALDDSLGAGEIVRSQSVLAGVYDPRSIGVRRLRTNTQTGRSPTTGRYNTYRTADEDDDGQTSMTTYIHSHSVARKTGSNGSWDFDDHEPRSRMVRTESRVSRRRTGDLGSGPVSTPARHRSLLEHDRTLRGSGGARAPARPLTHVLARSPHEQRRTPGQLADQLSSTSSGASSRRPPGSLQRAGHPAPSGMVARRERPESAARHHSRLSIRPDSVAGIGVAGMLSPTPDVDYHRLLISAFEALERGLDEDLGDGHETLVGLLGSVVKNSCRIDATLGQLAEASVAAQVDIELMDDEEGSAWEATEARREGGGVWKQRWERMGRSVAQMEKVQAQLVRTSNDQIRDLTEVLIWLNTLARARQRGETGGGDDKRMLSSRASGRFGASNSPAIARQSVGASPLSVISSHDESPLARAKPHHMTHEQSGGASRHDEQSSGASRHDEHSGGASRHQQPQRASTISFANERPGYLGGMHHRLRAKHRLSGGGKMGGSLVTSMSSTSLVSSQTVAKEDQGREEGRRGTVDEFGKVIRRTAEGRMGRHEDGGWTPGGGAKTIRGPGSSSVVFPRTPPRLATASLSHMTAHSNVSPTKAGERESGPGWRERSEEEGRMVRPQSSMSQIIDRANDVLSRVGYYPESPQQQTGRRSSEYGPHGGRERHESGASVEETRRIGGPPAGRGGERSEAGGRGATAATAALERLSQMGSWQGRRWEEWRRQESESGGEEERRWRRQARGTARASVSTYVVGGGAESEVDGDQEFDDDDEDYEELDQEHDQQSRVSRRDDRSRRREVEGSETGVQASSRAAPGLVLRSSGSRGGGVGGNGAGNGIVIRNGNGNGIGNGNGQEKGLGKRTGSIQKLFGGMRRG